MSSMIISGFPGIGKTQLSKKYTNVIDLDGMPYIYKLTKEQENVSYEKLKGLNNRIKNANWPTNYVEEILKSLEQYDIVLISQHRELLEELDRRNIEYVTVFPEKECKEEYIQRYKDRGNYQIYIDKKSESFYSQIDFLTKNSKKYWILKNGEYLEGRLIKEGVYLKERK